MKKKVLVLVEDYPSENSQTLMYVHVRNKYYVNKKIDVTVLSFRTKQNYNYDGIKVISLDFYRKSSEIYDTLICHAANIKHHYAFLNKYEKKFANIIFFYHGHEILKLSEYYPKNYFWVGNNVLKIKVRDIYDKMKMFLWKNKIKKILYKSRFIFVSKWLYERFLFNIHINPKLLYGHVFIINNSVGNIFEKQKYKNDIKKEYDFITIRGNALDKSEKGIDIVYNLAKCNPDNNFLIIGKGKFFDNNILLSNINLIQKSLTHAEMIEYINKSRCALMPTKHDTQGVMTCELATFGIPTITSDIEICHEIFGEFKNVKLIDNLSDHYNLYEELLILEKGLPYQKNEKYYSKNTIEKEVELIMK